MLFQLDFGDSLTFFDGRDLQSQQIKKLHKNSYNSYHDHKMMTISTSIGKDMLVQFLTDDQHVQRGFRAYFQYKPIEPSCANWLNMTAQLLKSPDYPTINCSWVITAPSIHTTIDFNFDNYEVKFICF